MLAFQAGLCVKETYTRGLEDTVVPTGFVGSSDGCHGQHGVLCLNDEPTSPAECQREALDYADCLNP